MSEDSLKFCRDILSKVSRSFALTIPMLDDVIQDEVLVTYLQDRILDNFEDEVEGIEFEKRKMLMDTVCSIFSAEDYDREKDFLTIEKNSSFIQKKPLRELNQNIREVYTAYNNFDDQIKDFSHKWLVEMNKGMQKYLQKEVETFSELDEYCYYVAGTVGGFLTDLIIFKLDLDGTEKEVLHENFNEAGLFLQKVNLIRDIKDDLENRAKHFWPLKDLGITEAELRDIEKQNKSLRALDKMLADVLEHIESLVRYYKALPDELSGYRKFFAVNNALGIATIEKLKDNKKVFYGRKPVKVSKIEFLKIIKSPEKYFLKKSQNFKL
ncbi:MAG: squalene/phytoene synthase family protein [Bacillota bacterium]